MRIVIALVGFAAIITGPWWIPLICMILLSARRIAPEAVIIGVLMDFVWQGSAVLAKAPFHGVPLFTLFGLALLWGLEPLRRRFLF